MLHTEFPLLILYGPTASGKSAMALRIAQTRTAVIINADAMQCYAGLPILTAQPSEDDMRAAPHALYSIWQPEESGNAQVWAELAATEIRACWARGLLPLLVGGSGLYLRALLEGFHAMPEIDDTIREQVRSMDQTTRRALLEQHDPERAAQLKAGDSQRTARALELVLSSGKPFAHHQAQPKTLLLPEVSVHAWVLETARDELYARIDARFDAMLKAGALEEARAFLGAHAQGTTPIFKAHGLPEFRDFFNADITRDEAVARAKQHTRNYAKRQQTWARQQLGDWQRVDAALTPELSSF